MNKVFKIKTDKINSLTTHEVISRTWFLIIPVLIGVYFSIEIGEYGPLAALFIIFSVIMLISFYIKREYVKTYRYFIGESKIGIQFDLNETNLLIKIFLTYVAARNKRRFGINEGRLIAFNEIGDLKISDKKIVITAKNNNILTNNGKLIIPGELEEYETIKAFFVQIQERLNIF